MSDDAKFYRNALIDLFNLEECISDDRDLIVIDKVPVRGWVAWHAEYPEEGAIRLDGKDDEPCEADDLCVLVKGHDGNHYPPTRAPSPDAKPEPAAEET